MTYLAHLLYTSHSTQRVTTDDLRTLTAESAARNHSVAVTGMLLYSAGTFLQLLEGRARILDALMKRIAIDPRHTDVRVLIHAPAPQRLFPRWYMGALDLDTAGTADDRARVSAALSEGLGQVEAGQRALTVLREFRRLLPARHG
ncbi:BLUF domain-containing protein [Gemmatimonas groenlandica]|uniref:BLUF domain-containing protein n=1 Tax=Gemmatimonas groenlandica TaxID=2732249 RepID=A0A6M4ILQ7_9BACT|nr:BLUF domain-containing protein [Gemmatimonas groenlandica]QJR35954.1 BLUF domain-containing protein [Gemmatimonas groenlandica]